MRILADSAQDLRHAVRGLVRERGFAAVAILTLALGIGATSAAFTLVRGVLLAPLPYGEPDRLIAVWEESEAGVEMPVAWPNFQDWNRASLRTIAGIAAYIGPWTVAVHGGVEPMRASLAQSSGNLFDVLGVAPLRGRTFVAEERVPNGRPAVIVSHAFWRRHLRAREDLSQLSLNVDGAVAPVIGVMPPGFDFPGGVDLWYPAELQPSWGTRTAHNFRAIARLAPGAQLASARGELGTLARQIGEQEPESNAASVVLRPLHEQSVGDAGRALLILMGASTLVLLVACTNLASALLARATRRRRELAVRAALGAARGRLVRQLLAESLLLAGAGAAAGLLLANYAIALLRVVGPHAVPRLNEVAIDGWVLGFAVLLVLLTAVAFGIGPALRATAAQSYDTLRGSGRDTASPVARRAWSTLIGTEVALALLLAVGSGLLIRSFWNVIRVDPGFDGDRTLAVGLDLPQAKYADGEQRVAFYDMLLERVSSLAGVEDAAMTMSLPLTGFDPSGRFDIEGTSEHGDGNASYRVVSPGFFEALRIPVVRGRTFTDADRAGALDVIVINETLAQRHFGAADPIGRRIMTGGMDSRFGDYATIVGVVGNVRHGSLTGPATAGYYLPYMQRPDRIGSATLLVRTAGRPERLARPVRDIVRSLDPDVPLEVSTVRARIGDSVADRRFTLVLLGAFALIALVLAAVGIYGVVSCAVAQRTREVAIRLALGAGRQRVLWLVGRETMTSAVIGVAVGLAGAALLSRVLSSLLYETSPVDPVTFAAVAMVLVGTAWLAVVVPGRRATRVSPMVAMRAE